METEPRTVDPRLLPASVWQRMKRDPAEGTMAPPSYGQMPLPHIHTVAGRHGIVSSAYLNIDEATRDSRTNAERMRSDCGIMECLEGRQRATALLPWNVEPPDENDPAQKQLATDVRDIMEEIPRFTEMRRCLLEALWYGRQGVALQYAKNQIKGQWRNAIGRWEPRNGDKLVFRYDDGTLQHDPEQVGIKVNTSWRGVREYRDPFTGASVSKVQPTEQGLVYWFDRWERDTVIVHRHMVEDAPYHDPIMAGRINGVGIRDRIYWTWYAMIECLQRVVEYLDRAAFGIEVWPYQAGNAKAKLETEAAASEAMGGGRTVILAPLPPDEMPERYMPHLIEPGLGGVNTTIDIIRTYFGHKIKRYILGQTLTSEADATGLGSGVADAHLATFADIIEYDARNLEETITTDLLKVIQRWNFPGTEHIKLKFKINTESPQVQQKMKAYESAYNMGLKIRASEVYDTIGSAMPDENDEVLQNSGMGQPDDAAIQNAAVSSGQALNQSGISGKPMNIEDFTGAVMRAMQAKPNTRLSLARA